MEDDLSDDEDYHIDFHDEEDAFHILEYDDDDEEEEDD